MDQGWRSELDVFEDRSTVAVSRSEGLRHGPRQARGRAGVQTESAGLADVPHTLCDTRVLPGGTGAFRPESRLVCRPARTKSS